MLSRIADSLYWMSRYLERVDSTARLIDINLLHLIEAESARPEANEWRPLLAICGHERAWVLDHLDRVVVKAVSESGGYGMLMGPVATPAMRADFAKRIEEQPRNYIAQPVIPLSRHLCYLDGELESRHIDLRPFVIHGEEIHVVPGGLTRVALTKGSLVVNSSQGGGSKDTWVLTDAQPHR